MGQLLANSSVLSVGTYIAQLITVLTYWIAARHLSPSRFGPVLGAVGLALLVITVADMGINNWAVRGLASSLDGKQSAQLFETTLGAKLVLASLLGSAWIVFCIASSSLSLHLVDVAPLGVLVTASIVAATLSVPLRAMQRMALVSMLLVLEKGIAFAVTIVCFIIFPARAIGLTIGLAGGSLVAAFTAGLLIRRWYRWSARFSLTELPALFKSSISFGLAGLASQLQRADVALVTIVAGPSASGLYGAAARLSNLLGVLPTAFSQTVYPFVAGATNRRIAYRNAFRTGSLMLLSLSASLFLCFLYAPLLISILLGAQYQESASVLRIYLLGILLAALNQPLSMVLQAEHDEAFVARVIGAASLVGLGGVAVGAFMGGAVGAASGFIILQATASIFLIGRVSARARFAFARA